MRSAEQSTQEAVIVNATQRILRDHYSARAVEIRDAAKASQRRLGDATRDAEQRRARSTAIGAELDRLRLLRTRVDELTPVATAV